MWVKTLDIKFKGLTQLEAKLKANTPEMKTAVMRIVQHNGDEMMDKMKHNMDSTYTAGYSTGKTRRTTTRVLSNDGFKVAVGPVTPYSGYLEYGTRFMSPRPTVRPAFLAQSAIFTADLKKVFK